MSSDIDSDNTSASGSGSRGKESASECCGYLSSEVGVQMEVVPDVREDTPEEIAKSSLPTKVEYKSVAPEVRTQYSLFIWSCLLHSWLGCVLVFEKDASPDIVSLERVNC